VSLFSIRRAIKIVALKFENKRLLQIRKEFYFTAVYTRTKTMQLYTYRIKKVTGPVSYWKSTDNKCYQLLSAINARSNDLQQACIGSGSIRYQLSIGDETHPTKHWDARATSHEAASSL